MAQRPPCAIGTGRMLPGSFFAHARHNMTTTDIPYAGTRAVTAATASQADAWHGSPSMAWRSTTESGGGGSMGAARRRAALRGRAVSCVRSDGGDEERI
ncbi:MAG TPA: hypothetical protein VK540_15975 [Polyangiaceae bacterium]|nr:hypothetical protein [Polyangiaceae bacterium]